VGCVLELEEVLGSSKLGPSKTKPHAQCKKDANQTVMWIVIEVLIMHFLASLVGFGFVIPDNSMVFTYTKVVQGQSTDIYRPCHKVPLAQRKDPNKDILTL